MGIFYFLNSHIFGEKTHTLFLETWYSHVFLEVLIWKLILLLNSIWCQLSFGVYIIDD